MELGRYRDWILAISLANLCLVRTWVWFNANSVLAIPPTRKDYLAAIGNMILLTIGWRLLLWLAVREGPFLSIRRLLRVSVVLPILINIDYFRATRNFPTLMFLRSFLGKTLLIVLSILVLSMCIYVVSRKCWFLVRVSEWLILIMGPVVIVNVGMAAWHISKVQAGEINNPSRGYVSSTHSRPRVVWLLFDEMDQRLSFTERPQGLSLPEFDRFRDTALSATNSFPPGPATRFSVPSLLTGRMVFRSKAGAADYFVGFKSTGVMLPWISQPNIFKKTADMGGRIGVAGWFFPYCALDGSSLEVCLWAPNSGLIVGSKAILIERMIEQLNAVAPWYSREVHLRNYRRILGTAKELTADNRFDLVYIHWPVPHGYGIYNRRKREFTLFPDTKEWYLDNLALADRSLGEIRHSMEVAGVWDKSTILITSDHPWRESRRYDGKSGDRVPFMLKLADQKTAIRYDPPFDTVVTHDLIWAILGNKLKNPEDVARAIDKRQAIQQHNPSGLPTAGPSLGPFIEE